MMSMQKVDESRYEGAGWSADDQRIIRCAAVICGIVTLLARNTIGAPVLVGSRAG